MRSETVTAVLPASQKAVFEYMSDIEKLPSGPRSSRASSNETAGTTRSSTGSASSTSRSRPTLRPA
jgi:hypothetical protein